MNYTGLKACALFHDLTEKEIETTLEQIPCTLQTFKKGQTIIHLGDTASQIGIIVSGQAEVQKIYGMGSQISVTIRKAGAMIGPAAVFSHAKVYPCDIIAKEVTSVLFIDSQNMVKLMKNDERIMNRFLTELASATFMLQQKIEMMSYNHISQKVAFTLLVYYRQSGKTAFPIPESMTKWAQQLNVSRPSLHRELKKMEEKGMIRYQPPAIEILDRETLEDLLI